MTLSTAVAFELKLSRVLVGLLALVSLSVHAVAQTGPNLQVQNFSVYSTLPQADGKRLVSVSFREVNAGDAAATASVTRVTIGQSTANFAIPGLRPGVPAYVSHFTRATDGEEAILVELDVNHQVPGADVRFHYTAKLSTPESDRWVSIGPSKIQGSDASNPVGVGRVTTLAIDPRTANTVYVGARGSGLWKTTDGGATWTPVADALPSARVEAVAIDPARPDRVLVASPAGVFESRDGGSVWSQLTNQDLYPWGTDGAAFLVQNAPDPVVHALARGPATNAVPQPVLYLSTQTGLSISQDGGVTWKRVLGQGDLHSLSPIGSLQFDTRTQTRLYASLSAFASSPGIYVGENGGVDASSWYQLRGCASGPLPPIPASSRVWVAQSGQTTWMSFLAGGADGSVRQLWKSTSRVCQVNGHQEQAWVQVPISAGCDELPKDNSSFLFLHPKSPSIVFKSGRRLCRDRFGSSPGWIKGVHDDQHSIAVAPSNPAVMYLGNDGGIYRSNDTGATWKFVGEGLAVSEYLSGAVANNGTSVVAGAWDNGGSGGSISSPIWTGLGGGDVTSVDFDRADNAGVYFVDQGIQNNIYRAQGSSIQSLSDPNVLPDCTTGSEVVGVTGEIVSTGSTPKLVVACAGLWSGPPWQQINAAAGNTFNRVRRGPNGVWLAGTSDGRVFGGDLNSLRPLIAIPSTNISGLAFGPANVFYVTTRATYGQGRVFRLDCQGSTATLTCTNQDMSAGLPTFGQITTVAADSRTPDVLVVAIFGGGLFHAARSASGWQWSPYNNGLPAAVTAFDLETASNGELVLFTWGRGAFRLPGTVQRNSVHGRLTSFESARLDPQRPPGASNPLIVTVSIDAMPDWLFSASNLDGTAHAALQHAFQNHTPVTIDYAPTGARSGRIIGAH